MPPGHDFRVTIVGIGASARITADAAIPDGIEHAGDAAWMKRL